MKKKIEKIEEEKGKGGWEKRSITDAHKVKDISDTYISLGFEVMVKTYNSERDCKSDCDICLKLKGEECKVIYTRPKKSE
jgi:hypothetical protein